GPAGRHGRPPGLRSGRPGAGRGGGGRPGADRLARRRALATGAASAVVTVCLGAAVVGVLAAGIAAVRDHHLSAVMLAVLPLAAIGAFETVPALAGAAVRAGD